MDVNGFAVADMRADPRVHVRRHTHEAAHFIVVLAGRYVTSASGGCGPCGASTVIYNPPGTTHQDRFAAIKGRMTGRFLSISVEGSRMSAIGQHVSLAERAVCLSHPDATTAAVRLRRELDFRETASQLAVEGLCLELVAAAARRPERPWRSPPPWLNLAEELLRDVGADPRIDAVAGACGVHPVHLARTFRRFYGCPPAEYRSRCRLNRAAHLLRTSNQRLSDIALACGFCDQSQMSRAFRRVHAIAPSEYRRAWRVTHVAN
jgi:AraC family transcriptional regulator